MALLYGIAVLAGSLALLAWIIADALADGPRAQTVGPTQRFGEAGPRTVSAVLGFGLGGMAASFAGWSPLLAFGAALGGAAALVAGTWLLADDRP